MVFTILQVLASPIDLISMHRLRIIAILELPRFSGQLVKLLPDYRRERKWERNEEPTRRS